MSKLFLAVLMILIASGCDVPEVSDARMATPPPTGTTTATPEPTEQPAVVETPVAPFTGTTAETPAPTKQSAAESEEPVTATESPLPSVQEGTDEDEFEAWWELEDDSLFEAKFEPSPPRPGKNKLKADLSIDDGEHRFNGTLQYRISPTEESDVPWIDLAKVREDDYGNYYEADVELPPGGAYVQFHVKDEGDEEFTDLTDWKVTPR